MAVSIIAIVAFFGIAILVSKYAKKNDLPQQNKDFCTTGDCSSCGETAINCERERRLKDIVKPIEYYDDEELDVYIGRSGDSYTAEETEQFAYILHTMRTDEVRGWASSLEQRGINVPEELKDEMIMMIEDEHS